jgi:hypothetical protein
MRVSILLCLFCLSCGPETSGFGPRGDGGVVVDCTNPPPDTDGDTISDEDEGAGATPRDTDQDGVPDYKDDDSDGDGIPDRIEAGRANRCVPPVDSDQDGKPNFRDLDSDDANDSTLSDADEAGPNPAQPIDTDSDGVPDFADEDDDADGILDRIELTPVGTSAPVNKLSQAPDQDQDGTPDFVDTDSDNDTIPDVNEGSIDTDGDTTGNWRDTDSDGDCVLDSAEAGDGDPNTLPVDTDKDGAPDFLDRDADADGLTDDKEDKNCDGALGQCETDRLRGDTDLDGVTDLIEQQGCAVKPPAVQQMLMCQCDGADITKSPLSRGDFVFIVDYMTPPSPPQSTLDLTTDVKQADVVVAIDTTGSMGDCARDLATNLANVVVPGVQARVSNVAFGVVDFKDFTDAWVVNYRHRIQTMKTGAGLLSVRNALTAITGSGGGDNPEAGWEALYSIAGGPAKSGPGWASAFNLAATPPAPATAGETQGTLHGAGFRAGSVPIIVAVADAEFHDKPGTPASGENGRWNYGSGTDCTSCSNVPSRAETVARLQAIGAHVIGLGVMGFSTPSGHDPKARFAALANETGAVVTPADFGTARPAGCGAAQCCTGPNGAGEGGGSCPLSFNIPRSGSSCPVSDAIVAGIVTLAAALKFDVHVEASDVDPNTVDNFIFKLVPNLTGAGPAAVCITVPPQPLRDDYTGPKATAGADGTLDTLPGINGHRICFDVVPKTNATVMPLPDPQIFRAQLQVKGVGAGGSINLGTPREVFFLVPPKIENGPIQ